MEMLAVLFILALFAGIAMALYRSAMADAENKSCRANMQSIANAEEQYRIKSASHTYTTDLSKLRGEVLALPQCPSGGVYSVRVSADSVLTVDCTRHGSFTLGRDND